MSLCDSGHAWKAVGFRNLSAVKIVTAQVCAKCGQKRGTPLESVEERKMLRGCRRTTGTGRR
jgi:hypothetical protein